MSLFSLDTSPRFSSAATATKGSKIPAGFESSCLSWANATATEFVLVFVTNSSTCACRESSVTGCNENERAIIILCFLFVFCFVSLQAMSPPMQPIENSVVDRV